MTHKILVIKLTKASESVNVGIGTEGAFNLALIGYQVFKDGDATGDPMFFTITPIPMRQHPSNLSNYSYFPLLRHVVTTPTWLNNRIYITPESEPMSNYHSLQFRVQDENGEDAVFDKILLVFDYLTNNMVGQLTTNPQYQSEFGNSRMQN